MWLVVTLFPPNHTAEFRQPAVYATPRTDPRTIPITFDRSRSTRGSAFANYSGIYMDPGLCNDWPNACEWIKWHERCHYLYLHDYDLKCDGSLNGENSADDYAVLHATAEQTREAVAWFRWLHRSGYREIGTHMQHLARADRIESLLNAKLQTQTVSAESNKKRANSSINAHRKVR